MTTLTAAGRIDPLTLAEAARLLKETAQKRPAYWVYFIQDGEDGPIKIGIAKDPADRITERT